MSVMDSQVPHIYTIIHVLINLFGTLPGFAVLFGMPSGKRLDGWTKWFLIATDPYDLNPKEINGRNRHCRRRILTHLSLAFRVPRRTLNGGSSTPIVP
jgi:hypothetical protein